MEALANDDPPSIGGYELRARLGEGGFGLVYLGLSAGGRAVAVKVLRREFARDQEFLRRFRLEVAAAQRVNGVYTAPVVASGLNGRPPWLATAFVPGPPLDQAVARHGPLPESALWRLLAGLVEALQEIHACGLVHRDLKPANVLLAPDGPRVIDFGISKAIDGTAMTSTGVMIGTPTYMAPEQARGLEVSPATDVFALGGVMAYAATGAPPFGGGNAVLYRVVHEPPSVDRVPPVLRDVVIRCLDKDPVARPSLTDLAAIGRYGPRGIGAGQSPASFWPPQVAQLIREHQDRLDIAVTARVLSASSPSAAGSDNPPETASSPSVLGSRPRSRTLQPRPPTAGAPSGAARTAHGRAGATTAGIAQPRPAPPPLLGTGRPSGLPPGYLPLQPERQPAKTQWKALPGTVRSAVVLMRAGAGIAALSALAVLSGNRAYAATAARAVSSASVTPLTVLIVLAWLVVVGLWLWQASAAQNRQAWVRTMGTALFGAFTLLQVSALYLGGVTQHSGVAVVFVHQYDGLLTLLTWPVGLVVLVLLWLRPSGRYFRSTQLPVALPACPRRLWRRYGERTPR